METVLIKKLIKRRAAAKTSLTRLQNYISAGEYTLIDLQLRFDDLPTLFSEFKSAQTELEELDDADHADYHESFEELYYQVKAVLISLLQPTSTQNLPKS